MSTIKKKNNKPHLINSNPIGKLSNSIKTNLTLDNNTVNSANSLFPKNSTIKQKSKIIFPKGTAKWLLENHPKLSHEQICNFCNLTTMELEILKNKNIGFFNPIGLTLSIENILECEKNHGLSLKFLNDFSRFQPARLRRPVKVQLTQNEKNQYILNILQNRENNSICINKMITMLRVRSKTIIKAIKIFQTTKQEVNDEKHNNIFNNNTSKLNYSENDIAAIYKPCTCEKLCPQINKEFFNIILKV